MAKKKGPRISPMRTASKHRTRAALEEGKLALRHGNRVLEVPLVRRLQNFRGEYVDSALQRVGRLSNGDLITMRSERWNNLGMDVISVRRLDPVTLREMGDLGAFSIFPSIGHMALHGSLRGGNVGREALSMAEKHIRSLNGGSHTEWAERKFRKSLQRQGFEVLDEDGKRIKVSKSGRTSDRHNLSKYHRIKVKKGNGTGFVVLPIQRRSVS